jgi:cobalamin biosynthesis protein CobD/CbiB
MTFSLRKWLERPQRTNRQAIVIGVVVWLLTTGLFYGLGWLLDVATLIDFQGTAPVWLVALFAGAALSGGFVVGRSTRARSTREIRAYDAYAEHLADAMTDLRKAVSGQLAGFLWRDLLKTACFSRLTDC